MPWVADGLEPAETEHAQSLLGNEPSTLIGLIAKPWITDGMDDGEAAITDHLAAISRYHYQDAPRLVAMPFLDRIGPGDQEAVAALADMAGAGALRRVLQHPLLSDGITDQLTPLIAALAGPARHRPSLIDPLLNAGPASIEEHVITLPLAGPVRLAIVNADTADSSDNPYTLELLEHAVRAAEHFMKRPFPVTMAVVLYAPNTGPRYGSGNYRFHIIAQQLPSAEGDDRIRQSEAAMTLAHEVARYYWRGDVPWLNAGISELMALTAENARTGRPLTPRHYPCRHAHAIAQVSNLAPAPHNQPYHCHYTLGSRLFLSLSRQADNHTFRQTVQLLYDAYQHHTRMPLDEIAAIFALASLDTALQQAYVAGTAAPPNVTVAPAGPLLRTSDAVAEIWVATPDCASPIADDTISIAAVANAPVYFCLRADYRVEQDAEFTLLLSERHADGFVYRTRPLHIPAPAADDTVTAWISINPPHAARWTPGAHTLSLNDAEGVLVAQETFTVNP